MAEAHSAVAFSFSITHEGWDVNFDREVLNLVWQSGIRSWKKRVARFMNSVHNGVYPAQLWTLWITMGIISAIHFSGYKVPYDLVTKVMPFLPGNDLKWQLIGSSLAALGMWLTVIYLLRYTLKLLFIYKGWIYEERGKGSSISAKTKLWFLAVRVLSGWTKPKLYSFQGSLPKLPLPSVHDTTKRYLKGARPLLDDEEYKRMEALALEFEKGIGVKLQRYLILKSWWSSNYVSDWWEEYVYLRGRSSLMINSNFYGMDTIMMPTSKTQAERGAYAVNSFLQHRRSVDRQELAPIMVQGVVPLCSWQYERIYNTTRIPGIETDKIQHWSDSNHIVVYHKGRYFKVIIYKGRILRPDEIQEQFEYILKDKSEPHTGEKKLAALTASDRTNWANVRRTHFSTGINKTTLDTVEKAAFVVTLDDVPYEFDIKDTSKLDAYAKGLMHGSGYDRWFDKSFTLCVGTNGRLGFNAEHSWGDAAVMSHIWELLICDETMPNGHGCTDKKSRIVPPTPTRLKWDINENCQQLIKEAVISANVLISDIDLKVVTFQHYGKDFIKKAKVSPDAYLQMALQLAYFRDIGKFSLTYEASMTRLYREGRTETVRPVTMESTTWVRTMLNENSTIEERIRLLQKACKVHQKGYQDTMCGKGIDRHLFCLYVVSKYLEVESSFLKEVLSEPWRLSTSQTPHGQTGRINNAANPNCISAGGGFGPVADDGYGISYIIAGENTLFFHISNKRSSKQTDCHRFAEHLVQSLMDMKNMFLESNKSIQNGSK